jgi:hypothetical protein
VSGDRLVVSAMAAPAVVVVSWACSTVPVLALSAARISRLCFH